MSLGLNIQKRPESENLEKLKSNPTAVFSLKPRPPIPGSENKDEKSKMGFEETGLKPAPSPWEGSLTKTSSNKPGLNMAPSPQAGSEAGSGVSNRGFEPEGSADVTPPFSESNGSNGSQPQYLKWAENLHNLLSDSDGVELYKTYMKNENVGELLDFWFACEGLKRLPSDQNEKIYQIIKVINKKFLRSKLVPIGEETRKEITDKIATKSGTDQTIFDQAQVEVEERMTRTTYRNFLTSEMYLNYIQNFNDSNNVSPKAGSQSNDSSSITGNLKQDDSGHFSDLRLVGGDQERSKSGGSQVSTMSKVSNVTSDSGTSVSVIVPTPGTSQVNTSTADGSMMGQDEPVSMSGYNMSHSSTLPTLHENSELDLEPPSLPPGLMSSLTASNINRTQMKRHQIKPESQAGIYLQDPRPGGQVAHPYHAYNSAYNPVSRQDSELQSLSSDQRDTTDDNMSSFTESSSHYSNHYRLQHNKKYLRRQARKVQEQSRLNREHQFHPQANSFIPRTDRIPAEATHELSTKFPAQFAEILIKKLEKLKRDQDNEEKLKKIQSEDSQSMVSQGSNRSLAEILKKNLLVSDDFDQDQSILDDHVSRVWTDKTPLRSPGDPSGRPRSPGYNRRGHGAPTMTRGPPPMGPPSSAAPRRNVASGGGARRGPTYHQDLAYYDLGGPQVPVAGAGVNERVRDWIVDVERQSAEHLAPMDQRSHSSKNTKTSPRSNRLKSGGQRSVSQERMMSSSWSAGAGPAGDQRQRLGASLVMPPPSQTNTLRKQVPNVDVTNVTIAVYTFSHEKGEPMPYRIKIPTKNVTLRHVKDFLPKKGAFRFYFKTEIDGDMCYEEETEDSNQVPLWEGKILVQCRLVE